MYTVVKFVEENVVECVPEGWIQLLQDGPYCLWPHSYKGRALLAALRNKESPCTDWDRFKVTVLKKNIGKI